MGPKISRGKAQSGSTDTPDTNRQSQRTDTPADAENVEWDGSLIDKARWFFNLLDAGARCKGSAHNILNIG